MSDKDNTYINYAEPPARTGEKGIREKVKALAIKVKAAVEKGAETLSELFGDDDEYPEEVEVIKKTNNDGDDDEGDGSEGDGGEGDGGEEHTPEKEPVTPTVNNAATVEKPTRKVEADAKPTMVESHDEWLLRQVESRIGTPSKSVVEEAVSHENPRIRLAIVANHSERLTYDAWERLILDAVEQVSKIAICQALNKGKHSLVEKLLGKMTPTQLNQARMACASTEHTMTSHLLYQQQTKSLFDKIDRLQRKSNGEEVEPIGCFSEESNGSHGIEDEDSQDERARMRRRRERRRQQQDEGGGFGLV